MPEFISGTCPWCERHNVQMYLVTGVNAEEGLIAQYICGNCKNALHQWQEEKLSANMQKIKNSVKNNNQNLF